MKLCASECREDRVRRATFLASRSAFEQLRNFGRCAGAWIETHGLAPYRAGYTLCVPTSEGL
jgi:hypothetical protein